MAQNYKQIFAKRKECERRIKSICPKIDKGSGIYVFYRTDENDIKYAYVGQAKHLLDRCSSHLLGYQHIDLSIKKHGLKSDKNPYGYELFFRHCEESNLDMLERQYIKVCANKGYQLRNSTLGGQDSGKVVTDSKPSKGYRDGLKQGYENCRKEFSELFKKYLVAEMQGKPNKIKERKLKAFEELIQ